MVEKKKSGIGKIVKKVTPAKMKLPKDHLIPKRENRSGSNPDFRANIGARNPFILAMRKLKMMNFIAHHSFFHPRNLENMLLQAYGLPYENAFDPQFGSPIYFGIYNVTEQLAGSTAGEISKNYESSLPLLENDPAIKVGAANPPECKNKQRSQNQTANMAGKPMQYRDMAGGTNQGVEFNDPEQGCVADCWLISALSSIAMAETKVNPAQKKIKRAPPIVVYPPSKWATPYNLTTTQQFYTDQTGGQAYYAHVKTKTAYNECWPPYYEKCFANYYSVNRVPQLVPPYFPQNDPPSYDTLNFGSPYAALEDITGKKTTNTTFNTKIYFKTGGVPDDVDGMIGNIADNACVDQLDEGEMLFTKKPSAACTYLSTEQVQQKNPLANRNDPNPPYNYGPAVAYNCEGMAANHAFSLIGLYWKEDTLNKYVILRNPWGLSSGSSAFNTILQNSLANPLPSLPAGWSIPNPGREGIFGLKALTFMRYFESFGWTLSIN